MTTQNIFYASPSDAAITGFVFTDLDSYHAEYGHRHCLFGTESYDLQIIRGNQIDLELFAGLKIGHASLSVWFDEIQHLTFDEKVGLWFLVHESGLSLSQGLEIVSDGITIYHGSKNNLAGLPQNRTLFPAQDVDTFIHEFHFAGETWCGSSVAY